MLAVIAHRGPDGHGLFRDDRVGLGHVRLSIVDLAGGFQPLTGEDRSVWITFNGEIFNHLELRRELEALGHRFTTSSDTEVVVHAYEQYGERAWPMLNGQFAFALWDRRAGRTWLVRDRLGILPLHWAEAAGQVVFASEAKALFASGLLDPALDPAGLAQVFTRWSARAPATAFAGVRAVRPGGAVCVDTVSGDAGGPARTTTARCAGGSPTWPSTPPPPASPPTPPPTPSATAWPTRSASGCGPTSRSAPTSAGASTRRSSARWSARSTPARSRRSRCASATPPSTRPPSSAAWPACSAPTTTRSCADPTRSPAPCSDVVWHCEAPLLRTAPVPLYLLSGLVRDAGMKVVLTGEGADELLAGYSIFKEDRVRRFWARRPDSAMRPALFARLHPEVQAGGARSTDMWARFFGRDLAAVDQPFYAHLVRWSNTAWTARLLHPDVRAAAATPPERLGRRRHAAGRDAARLRQLGSAGPGPVGRDRHVHVVVPAGLAGRPGGHGPRRRGALPVPRSRGGGVLQRVAA